MVIGLSGKARVGKDEVGFRMGYKHGFIRRSFADAVRETSQALFGFSNNQVFGPEKTVVDEYWNITPAQSFQIVGTDLIRNRYRDDFWIKRLQLDIESILSEDIVITDVRYPNELEWIVKSLGGIVIRINRKNRPDTGRDPNHESEIALDDYRFDYYIDNDGTKEELYNKIDNIINEIRNS